MRKNLLLLFFTLFSFSAIHAVITSTLSYDGTLTISGTGNMPDFSKKPNNRTTAPWDSQRDKIKTVVIKNGVTNIGDCAFYYCKSLTSITIPNSVTSVGDEAFRGCSSLTSITIPNSVTSIGNGAFSSCSGLTSITIPNSVTSIGEYIFKDCSGLTSIIVEEGNEKYDSRDNCNAIIETKSNTLIAICKNTVIPNSVTSIGEYAFYACSGLTSITIPNSVTSIGYLAFGYCSGLTSITIPNSVTSIGDEAFMECKGLTSITFERTTAPGFGRYVFYGVDKSIPVYVPFGSRAAYKEVLGNFGMTNIIQPSLSLSGTYTQKSQIEDVDVSYTRNFTNTKWQALYLPFSLKYEDWKDDFEIAYINAIRQKDNNDDGKIDETILEFVKLNSGSTVPNTPYIIRAKETGEKTLSAQNTTLYKAENNSVDCSTTTTTFTFTGIYKAITNSFTLMTKQYYVLDGEKFSKASILNYPKAYQWYMTISSRNSGYGTYNEAKDITISVLDDEEATGVSELFASSPASQFRITNYELPIYDINGRKVSEKTLKPGMYIKNGRKFIVK